MEATAAEVMLMENLVSRYGNFLGVVIAAILPPQITPHFLLALGNACFSKHFENPA